jgi:hypothetical protein
MIHLLQPFNLFSEIFAGHASVIACFDLVVSYNGCVFGDGDGCVDVVACAHNNLNSSGFTLHDRIDNGWSKWILESKQPDSSQIFFQTKPVTVLLKIVVSGFEIVECSHGHVFVGDEQSSVCLISKILNSLIKNIPVGFSSTIASDVFDLAIWADNM